MKRTEFRCLDRQRVRWVEVDLQKIVFNGHYLTYVDTAMAAYWRRLALPYQLTMEHLGGDLFVRKATLEYHAPAEYDDLLEVGVRCAQVGTSSLRFAVGVFRGETLLVSGELVYVFADPSTRRSQPVPAALREVMQAFEDGQAMVAARTGTWSELGAEASAIRREVFVREQNVPAEMEADAADAHAVHAVAHNRFGLPLATGRLLSERPGVARIGRMAVMRSLRGSQIGRVVLEALMAVARDRGDHLVSLHAQISAADFYRRAGFQTCGPEFTEAGIVHVEMTRPLG